MPLEINARSRLTSLVQSFAEDPHHNPTADHMMYMIEMYVSSDPQTNQAFEEFIAKMSSEVPPCALNKDFCLCSLMHLFALGVWCGFRLTALDVNEMPISTEKVM